MISESTQAVIVLSIAAAGGVVVDVIQIPSELMPSGATVTGAGAGAAFWILVKSILKRVDDFINAFKIFANHYIAHQKRTENIHRAVFHMLKKLSETEAGIPEEIKFEDTNPEIVNSQTFKIP